MTPPRTPERELVEWIRGAFPAHEGEGFKFKTDRLDELGAKINEAADALEQSLTDIARLEERVTWKPIESAPKDGTEVLAWVHTCAGGRVTTIEWLNGSGWVESYDLAGWNPQYGPTHWMPLPEPLSKQE
jgi:hypothetical protein